MKKIIITIITTLLCYNSVAQDVEYFILTSQSTRTNEGIEKIQTSKDMVENYGSIFFNLRSINKNINISFIHVHYNLTELAKIRTPRADDQMEMKTVYQSFVNSVNPIDLDVLFPTWTKEQAKQFYESKRHKKIYIIDRSTRKSSLLGYKYTIYQVRNATPPKF
jgi:hypothetical protein